MTVDWRPCFRTAATLWVVVSVAACTNRGGGEGDETMTIEITSSAFAEGEPIPARFTADGVNLSPPLEWSGIPDGTVELALICDDPDAPRADPWVHWVIYGIDADATGLPEGVPAAGRLDEPAGAVQGTNDFRRIGYGGPAPPRGHGVHHYHFAIYALDTAIDRAPGLNKMQLIDAMSGHVLARGELVGTYSR